MKKTLLQLSALVLMTASAIAGDFRHIVMFQFKESATPEQIHEIETAFAALPGQIDVIKGFEWGKMDNAEVGMNDGLTHSFLVTFKDKADLEKYLPHAAHQAFVAKIKPLLEKALVFDYEAKDK
jgi:hypothetical protein